MDEQTLLQLAWKDSPLLWAIDNKIVTESGLPTEFKARRFLQEPFDDWTPEQVTRKASQFGFSVTMLLKVLCAVRFRKWNVIYTLPTVSDVFEFVPSKFNPLIRNNPVIQSWMSSMDNTQQKQIGNYNIYIRGTFSGKNAKEKMESGIGTMISSDLNVHDEADRSDQPILEQYESRQANSKYQGRWYFSNPSTPFTLVQKKWEESDQKHWFIKCEHCSERQFLDFFQNVDFNRKIYVCTKCRGEISDEVRTQGEWVKKWRNKKISGYWMPHMICPWIPASKLVEDYQTKTRAYFYNFDLGLPYRGSETVVDSDVITRNVSDKVLKTSQNVIGVDQGFKKHYVIGNRSGIIRVGVTEDWGEIEKLIKQYDCSLAVFDALPDLTKPREIRDKNPGKVWLNYYKRETKKADFIKWDRATHTVYTDRPKILEMVIDELLNGTYKFFMNVEDLVLYIEHWKNCFRTEETDSMGIVHHLWDTDGEDHFIHATALWRIALEKAGGESKSMEWKTPGAGKDPNLAPNIKDIIEYNNLINT